MQMMQKFPLPKNKMKKYVNKILAAATAAAMMASMGGMGVMAEDTKTTTVKYDVTQSYTWSVPSTIDFTNAADSKVTTSGTTGATQNVLVTKNVIPEGKKLQITAAGSGTDGAFTIVPKGKSHTLSYTLKAGSTAVTSGGSVLEVAAGTNTGSATLTFTLSKDATERADNYEGTVTYTVAVVDAAK